MRAFARDWTCIVHGDTCPEAGMGWRCKVAVDWGQKMSADLPSDTAFEMFLATVTEADLSPYELAPYRHARFERLMEN